MPKLIAALSALVLCVLVVFALNSRRSRGAEAIAPAPSEVVVATTPEDLEPVTAEAPPPRREVPPAVVSVDAEESADPVGVFSTARVAGVVQDANGAPLPDCEVKLRPAGADEGKSVGTRIGSVAASAITDEDGAFELIDVVPGVYDITGDHEERAPSAPLALVVEAAREHPGLILTLRLGGTITGEIYREGVPDVDRKIGAWSREARDSAMTHSDEAGAFRCEFLAPGTYSVVSQPSPEDTGDFTRSADVEVLDGETVHVVLGAAPENPIRVHGVVTRAGEPVSTGVVSIADESSESFGDQRGEVDTGGNYEVVISGAGDFIVIYQELLYRSPPFDFPVHLADEDAVRVDIALPTGVIEGVVLDEHGDPVSGLPVTLSRETGPERKSFFGPARGAGSGDDGTFRITDLEAGTFSLRTGGKFYRGPVRGACTVMSGIELADGETVSDIVLRIPAYGLVKGRVLDPEGAGVPDAAVFAFDAEGRTLQHLTPIESDPTGAYIYDGAPRGDIFLFARSGSHASEVVGPIRVEADGEHEVDLTLVSSSRLHVTFEDAEGQAKPVRMSLFDSAGRDFAGLKSIAAMIERRQAVYPSADQVIGPLPAGRFRIEATAFGGGHVGADFILKGEGQHELSLRIED